MKHKWFSQVEKLLRNEQSILQKKLNDKENQLTQESFSQLSKDQEAEWYQTTDIE